MCKSDNKVGEANRRMFMQNKPLKVVGSYYLPVIDPEVSGVKPSWYIVQSFEFSEDDES